MPGQRKENTRRAFCDTREAQRRPASLAYLLQRPQVRAALPDLSHLTVAEEAVPPDHPQQTSHSLPAARLVVRDEPAALLAVQSLLSTRVEQQKQQQKNKNK